MNFFLPKQLIDRLSPEQQSELGRLQSQVEEEIKKRQEPLCRLEIYRILRTSIQDGMTLEEMIDAFSQMCQTPVGDPDDLLFETGTDNFTGENLFYFSLVRQFQLLNPDEYVQLHLDVLYTPSLKTKLLFCTKWDSQVDGDFFEMVKSSRPYAVVKDMTPVRVDVRIEET